MLRSLFQLTHRVLPLALLLVACSTGGGGDSSTTAGVSTSSTAAVAVAPTTTVTTTTSTTTSLATTTSEAGPTSELDDALARASGSECASENSTAAILDWLLGDQDFAAEEMGIFGEPIEEGGIGLMVLSGTLASPAAVHWVPYSEVEDDRALLHSALFMNHQRAAAGLGILLNNETTSFVVPTPSFDWETGEVVAEWDALILLYSGDELEFPALGLMRSFDPDLAVQGEARVEAWR